MVCAFDLLVACHQHIRESRISKPGRLSGVACSALPSKIGSHANGCYSSENLDDVGKYTHRRRHWRMANKGMPFHQCLVISLRSPEPYQALSHQGFCERISPIDYTENIP